MNNKLINKIIKPVCAAVLISCGIAACSQTQPEPEIKDIQLYRFKTLGKVDKINYWGGGLHRWQAVNDQTVIIWVQKSQAYLIRLVEHCVPLEYASGISFRGGNQTGAIYASHSTLTAVSKFDSAECAISEIYKLANKSDIKQPSPGEPSEEATPEKPAGQ